MASYDRDKVIPALDIGSGWTVIEVPRKQGHHIDRYWFSPVKKHRFRSKAEVARYKVALEDAPGNDEDAAWNIFKGKDAKAKAKAKAKGSPAKKRKASASSHAASSSSAARSGSSAKKNKKIKKSSKSPSIKSYDDGGSDAIGMSGADAGAGHPFPYTRTSKSCSSTAEDVHAQPTKVIKQVPVTSRKARGAGTTSTNGYIPNADPKTHGPDGPYVDEDEITRVYNFPKGTAGTEDQIVAPEIDAGGDVALEGIDEGGTPYRHITNWFLAAPGGVHRMELPAQARFVKKERVCLYGELLPSPKRVSKALDKGKEPPSNQPVVIRRGLLWSIDRDHIDRGIWFGTKDAWYKLEQPCTAKVYNGKSQEDLHVKLRAKFALVSNLLDMFTESSKALNLDSFFGLHACRSPTESHTLLSPSKEMLAEHQDLVAEPFDLELLKREAKFVREHLAGCHEDFTQTCTFVNGLAEMEKEWRRSGGGASAEDKFDYLASAMAAEARAGRLPWGCLSFQRDEPSTRRRPRINLLVEIKVERSRSPQQKPKKIKIQAATMEGRPWKKNEAAAAVASRVVGSAKKEMKVSPSATAPSRSAKVRNNVPKSPRGLPKDSANKVDASKAIRRSASSDDSMFVSSGSEDEWKPPGASIGNNSESLMAESSMQPVKLRVLDTKLYPILIDEVKRNRSEKIKPFLDAAAKVLETRADAFISSFVTTDTIASYELMLAVVESLRVSTVPVRQRLFCEKRPGTAACRSLFIAWLDAAKARMNERRNDSVEKCILDAVHASNKTEEEVAVAILRLARTCFGPETGEYPDSVSKRLDMDIIAIVKELKEFSQLHGIEKLKTSCNVTISQLKSQKKAKLLSARSDDPFGEALEQQNEVSSGKMPKANGSSTPHSSDSASYKAVGKAAAVMASVKKTPGSDKIRGKSGSSRKVGISSSKPAPGPALGSLFASELGIELPTGKPKKG